MILDFSRPSLGLFVSCVSHYGCFPRAVPSSRRTEPVSVRPRSSPQSILPSRWLCLTAAGCLWLCSQSLPSFRFFLATVSCSSMEGVSLLAGVYSGFISCMASDVTNLSLDYSAHSTQRNRWTLTFVVCHLVSCLPIWLRSIFLSPLAFFPISGISVSSCFPSLTHELQAVLLFLVANPGDVNIQPWLTQDGSGRTEALPISRPARPLEDSPCTTPPAFGSMVVLHLIQCVHHLPAFTATEACI